MDVAIAIALSAPIVVLCFVEAYNSGKLVSNSAVGFYATILAGSLIVVLAHSTWNEMEIRSIWRSQRSLSHEKKVYETILHDMLPTQYVRRIVRSVAVVGTKLKAIVLFSDLKGYSKLNEQMSAYEVSLLPLDATCAEVLFLCAVMKSMHGKFRDKGKPCRLRWSCTVFGVSSMLWFKSTACTR